MNHPILHRADWFLTISLSNRSHVYCFQRILVISKAQQKRGGDHEPQQGAIIDVDDDDDDDDGCYLLFGVCQKESVVSP